MKILGIESSCDDTACAVVEDGTSVLSSIVSSQEEIHACFGGIVPEVACRKHIENILPVLEKALCDAAATLEDIDAVAVTNRPGLIGALLIGVTAAKSISWALDLPLIDVDHLQAHIYGAWMAEEPPVTPAVSLVVSGGHTSLYLTENPLQHELIGSTADDAAGEAFDKVANMLKLGFPGGPAVDKAARRGNPKAVKLPRTWIDAPHHNFSFSGLKTAVLYQCLGQNASREDIENASYDSGFVADMAASFQEAVVDVLVAKTCAAAEKYSVRTVILGGGVAANSLLRERLSREATSRGLGLVMAPWELCRDNAAMTAGLAYHLFMAGRRAGLDLEARPATYMYSGAENALRKIENAALGI